MQRELDQRQLYWRL